MRRSFTVILLALLSVCSVDAQHLYIRDSETHRPLEWVVVSSNLTNTVLISNEKGRVDLTSFEGKNIDVVQLQLLGYKTLTMSLSDHGKVVYLEPNNFELEKVVVSATKWRQEKRNVPGKVLGLTPRDAALKNPQTAADLLEVSGEVFIQKSQQGGGSPMIRGFAANRLLYTVDGVRMNTAIFRSGNLHNVIALDAYALERTEVALGPGAVLYGSDAIGGVMNFQTLRPSLSTDEKPNVNIGAATRVSTANAERTAHVKVDIGWKKMAWLATATHSTFDDLKMGEHGPDDYLREFYVQRFDEGDKVIRNNNPLIQKGTGYSQFNLTQKLLYKPLDHLYIDYGLHYSHTSDIPRYDRLIQMEGSTPRSAEWFYGPQVWVMHNLGLHSDAPTALSDEMSFRLAGQLFEEGRHDRRFGNENLQSREERLNALSINVDLKKALNQRLELYYGMESILNIVESDGFTTNIRTDERVMSAARYPSGKWWSHGVYLMGRADLSSLLSIQSGLRYNVFIIDVDFTNNAAFFPLPVKEAELHNSDLSGNLGLVLRPSASATMSLNLSSGFRAPNIDDMGKIFDSEPGAVVVPNTDLMPEKVYSAELGLAKIFKETFQVDASVYYTYLTNAMVRRPFQLNGMDSLMYDGELSAVQAVQNAADAEVFGIHLGIELKAFRHWSWIGNLNLQKGEDILEDGSRSPSRHAAPAFGSTAISYRNNGLHIELSANYNAQRDNEDLPEVEQAKAYLYAADDNGLPYAPAWYTIDLHLTKQVAENWQFSLGLENISNQRYRSYSSGIAGPGRNLVLSVRGDF